MLFLDRLLKRDTLEIRVAMVGPRRAGKTSMLSAMFERFENALLAEKVADKVCLAADPDTADVLCAADASGNVRIATDTGDVVVDSITADTLDLTVSTGDVTVRNVKCGGSAALRVSIGKAQLTGLTCGSFTSTGSTGDLTMQDVRVREKASVERSAGDVRFERCDAEICVTTDTGDVSGSLLSDKVFFAQSDTGRIDVPKTISGGRCEIVSSTGDITMRVV